MRKRENKTRLNCARLGVLSGAVLMVCAASARAQLTVTLEPVPGQSMLPGDTIIVEAFIRNDGADFLTRGFLIDLACNLPGKPGSTGEVRAQPAAECLSNPDCPAGVTCNTGANPNVCNSMSIGNTSDAASGSIPWLFSNAPPNQGMIGGLKPIAQSVCRLGGSPGPGEGPYILPGGGARRYLGTWRFEASASVAGTFNIPYESQNSPCTNGDQTRVVDDNNNCVNASFVQGSLMFPCNVSAYDVAPCGGDGQVNLDDILGVLDAFAGITACPVPCPSP